MLIVYAAVGWFCGIWLAAALELPAGWWLILAASGGSGALLLRRWPQLALMLAAVAGAGLGGARYSTAVPTIDAHHVAAYNDGLPVTLTGVVVAEPDVRDRFVNLRVQVSELALPDAAPQPVQGLVLVRTFPFPQIPYGAELRINGRLETPPDDEDFSYKDYLARRGIHSQLFLPQITVLAENQGLPLYYTIFAFKQRAQATINRLIPDPQAALLAGILLGNDNGMPPQLDDDFRTTGMTHIIAISGFNVAILIMVLVAVAQPLFGRRGAVIFAVVGTALYTLLVGADASVVRAAIMGSVYLLTSRWLGRPTFSVASLLLAGVVMTLIRPFTLWDVGFQLSFAATLSLMLYAEPMTAWARRQLLLWLDRGVVEKIMGLLSEAVIITLAAQFLTLPLMVGHFGQLSLISLAANALILPAQPGVMIWGGLATLLGMVAPFLGQLFAWIAWLFLSYTIWWVRVLAAVPGAAVPLALPWTVVALIYAAIAGGTWLARQERRRRTKLLAQARANLGRRLLLGGSVAGMLLVGGWGLTQPDGLLHVAFLDVGQGDAIFIQTPTGRQILVDGGHYPSVLFDQLGRQIPFWDREIDLVVATHPDADHVSGLVGLFDRYRVERLLTDGSEMGDTAVYDAVLTAAANTGAPVHHAQAGEVILIEDGVRLEILHPGPTRSSENRNENSIALRLVYGDFTLLLTGDAEQQAEEAMLRSGRPLQALVFKAGHHGSNSSSSLPFLQAVQPQVMVISVGAENRFGHPHPDVLARAAAVGTAVLRTDELGTIKVSTDGRQMWWQARP